MNLHLAEIAVRVAPGTHAILLAGQAGWHLSAKLVVPANITIVPLPPKSPELNPVENIWQFMRDNWLSNRIFKSYEDILDHCCYAWNKLLDQTVADHVHRPARLDQRLRSMRIV
jgi:transposase